VITITDQTGIDEARIHTENYRKAMKTLEEFQITRRPEF
jgi:hypothetical protein